MSRILFAVTHPMTARYLMQGQLAYLAQNGFEVGLAAGPGRELEEVRMSEGVRVFAVPFTREMGVISDMAALGGLLRIVREFKPTIVNAGTPKAGLLGMLAARLTGIPVRVYTLRGLRLETTNGLKRRVLAVAERLTARCAHRIVSVSRSLQSRYMKLGLAPPEKTTVLGFGSSNGVDTVRFRPARCEDDEKERLRDTLGIPPDALVIGFVGRLTRDKGIEDLVEAFSRIRRAFPARLLLIGDYEQGDPVSKKVRQRLEEDSDVMRLGFVSDAAPCYRVMDVLAFPSYREGFPNVPLEAAASGLPVAGYAATGSVDAVAHGETGTLVPVGGVEALSEALSVYLRDPGLRVRHGKAGRERVEKCFRQERVWQAWVEEYRRLEQRCERQ